MATLVRWDPFREVTSPRDEVDRLRVPKADEVKPRKITVGVAVEGR
jgi:hypothetical protein